MNRIGIITFHRSYNYGSALQAYALQKYINDRKLGEAKVIDYILPSNFEYYKLFHFSSLLKNPRWLVSDFVYFFDNLRRKRNFEQFVQQYIPLTEKKYYSCTEMVELNDSFDMFICGSDQIWNLECTNGVEPSYFLKFATDNKAKVAYGPSVAHLDFPAEMLSELGKSIQDFKAISIREESNVGMLTPLTSKPIEVVLDPTLLLDAKDYENLLEQKHRERYVFVYMLEDNKELISYVDALAQKEDLKIVYISKRREPGFYDGIKVYGVSPVSFLEYLHDAEYVVTNSFHATVFSVLFRKKFCTFKTQKSYTRMVDLLNKLGLNERLHNDVFEISDEINYDKVNEKLYKLRQQSASFLERNCAEE